MRVDSGAGRTIVDANLRSEAVHWKIYLSQRILQWTKGAFPLAKVWIHVGDYSLHHDVAVVEEVTEPVLLGLNIGIHSYLLSLDERQREDKQQ